MDDRIAVVKLKWQAFSTKIAGWCEQWSRTREEPVTGERISHVGIDAHKKSLFVSLLEPRAEFCAVTRLDLAGTHSNVSSKSRE